MTIRLASISDAQDVCGFFSKYSSYQRDIPFWTWIHKQWSIENSISIVAEVKGEIVGNYSIIIQKVSINGIVFLAGLGVHALISHDYRKQISILDLSTKAYKEAKNRDLKFIYGFPNKNYRLVKEKLERWERVSLFNAMQLSSKKTIINSDDIATFELQKLLEFNHLEHFELAKLIELEAPIKGCKIKKNAKYYLNRYLKHPQVNYECFFIKIGVNIEGFIVFKQFEDNQTNTKHAHIMDFITSKNITNANILALFERQYRAKVDVFTVWSINLGFKKELEQNGFQDVGFDTFFGIKFLDIEFKNLYKEQLLNFNSWTLFMGESDAI